MEAEIAFFFDFFSRNALFLTIIAEILDELMGHKPWKLSLPKPCLYIGKILVQPISLAYIFPKSSACLHPSLHIGPISRQAAHLWPVWCKIGLNKRH